MTIKNIAVALGALTISSAAFASQTFDVSRIKIQRLALQTHSAPIDANVNDKVETKSDLAKKTSQFPEVAHITQPNDKFKSVDVDQKIKIGTRKEVNARYADQVSKSSGLRLAAEMTKQGALMAAACTTSTAVVAVSVVADLIPGAAVIPDALINSVDSKYQARLDSTKKSETAANASTGHVLGALLSAVADIASSFVDALPDSRINDSKKNEQYSRIGEITETAMMSSDYIAERLVRNENSLCHRSLSRFVYIGKEVDRRAYAAAVRQ